jgi:hypothetical protein
VIHSPAPAAARIRVLQSVADLGGRRRGMQAMLASLVADPDEGPLAYRMGFPTIVQYSVPESGVAAAGRVVPLARTSSARIRLRRKADVPQPATPRAATPQA